MRRFRTSLMSLAIAAGVAAGAVAAVPAGAAAALFAVAPSPLDFGAQVVGTTSVDRAVTITNPSGRAQTLQPLVFVQNDFRLVASDCPGRAKNFLLGAGASCTASFNFTPFAAGVRSLDVTLAFTSGGTPAQSLTLTGNGVGAGAQPAVVTEGDICGGGVCALGDGGNIYAGNFFSAQLSATGGTAPYTWSGQVSGGLAIQPDGVVLGAPAHSTTFTVTVTDATGASGSATFSVNTTQPAACQSGGGNVTVLTEPLSGVALGGQTPSGSATLTEDNSKQTIRSDGEPCLTSLVAQVSGVNLPDGTQLWVTDGSRRVGIISLSGGAGSTAPYARPATAGQVSVFTSFPGNGAQPILHGTKFS